MGCSTDMLLGDFADIFLNMKDNYFVFEDAFSSAHSYRGYYDELAFEPASNVSLAEIKREINKAFNESFEGYKGGEYKYDSDTPVHLACYGSAVDGSGQAFSALVKGMVFEYYKVHAGRC